MYSRYILLSALLVIGAETYAKNNKTEVVSLSSSSLIPQHFSLTLFIIS